MNLEAIINAPSVTLPDLSWTASPNHSSRHGVTPTLVVVHRPVGSYQGAIRTLCDPHAQVSSHIVTEGRQATQLVAWAEKAWTCVAFNAVSYNLEIADDAWRDPRTDSAWNADSWYAAARITAYLCRHYGIPDVWAQHPTFTLGLPHGATGICRHYDLGAAGGGHDDPTLSPVLWDAFMRRVKVEYGRGGFRPVWGR